MFFYANQTPCNKIHAGQMTSSYIFIYSHNTAPSSTHSQYLNHLNHFWLLISRIRGIWNVLFWSSYAVLESWKNNVAWWIEWEEKINQILSDTYSRIQDCSVAIWVHFKKSFRSQCLFRRFWFFCNRNWQRAHVCITQLSYIKQNTKCWNRYMWKVTCTQFSNSYMKSCLLLLSSTPTAIAKSHSNFHKQAALYTVRRCERELYSTWENTLTHTHFANDDD